MDTEGIQVSSSSASIAIAPPTPKNKMTNLLHLRDRLEDLVKFFKGFSDKSSENTKFLLQQIGAIIKRSKERWNGKKNVQIVESSSSSNDNNCQLNEGEVEEFQKFLDCLKATVKIFSYIRDEGKDENLDAVLFNVNFILRNSTISPSYEEEGSLKSPSKNSINHQNSDEPDTKRQKLTLDAEPNEKISEELLFRKEESPLENDVILNNLFKYCTLNDFWNFRLVSRKWNIIVTPFLKQGFHANFVYDKDKENYVKKNCTTATLSKLNNILTTSQDFPVVNFSFVRGDLGIPEARTFFKRYGKKIKRLFLNLKNKGDGIFPCTSITTFREILIKYAKNIEWMELWHLPKVWWENTSLELFPEPRNTIQLPRLTSLIIKKCNFKTRKSHRLVQDIIQAAVNLQTIRGYKIEFLDTSASAVENKIHLVKYIRFEPTEKNLDLYSKFAEGRPKLERMEISLDIVNNIDNNDSNYLQMTKKAIEIIHTIFESSKDTLENISKFPPLSHLPPGVELTTMEKVTKMSFTGGILDSAMNPQEIPRPVKLAQVFHNLRNVVIDVESRTAALHWLSCFDCSQPLPSVKKLEVLFAHCPRFVENLSALFPAVDNLKVVVIKLRDFRRTMSVIWKGFTKVEHLELGIFKPEEEEIITSEMDSGITGFSPDTCIQLKNNSRNLKVEDIEALRLNPSICDASSLASFIIKFRFEDEKDAFVGPIFSVISGIFGFGLVNKTNGFKLNIGTCHVVHGHDRNKPDRSKPDRNLDVALEKIAYYLDHDSDVDSDIE